MRIIISGFCSFIFIFIISSFTVKQECYNENRFYNKNDIEIKKIFDSSIIGISEKCILLDPKIEKFSREFGLKVIITREQYCIIRVPDEILIKNYINYIENRKEIYK